MSNDITNSQSEMSLVINPTNPLNLVGFSHRLASPIDMDLYRSVDGGVNWAVTRIDNADDGQGTVNNRFDPAVVFDANGTLYIAYGVRGAATNGSTSRVMAAASTDGGATFVNFRLIDNQADPGGAGTSPPGVDRWTLAAGRDPVTGLQAAYVTYSQNVTEGAGIDQRVVISGTRDGGANWTAPAIINDTSLAGFGSGLGAVPVVSSGGELFVTWWDGGTSVRGDRDRDGIWGNAFGFGTDLTIRNHAGLVDVGPAGPPAQPERGVRFSPSVAINQYTRDLYVTFHQRASGNDTDILFGRSSDFGDTWDWVTVDAGTGTEFNPWIAWDAHSGALGIAYYTTDGDQSTGNDDVRPRMALSTDNGNNWTRTFLSAQSSNEGPGGTGGAGYGGDYLEYIGFAFRDGTAHCLWASRYPGGGADLDAFTTRVSLDSATNGNNLRVAEVIRPNNEFIIRRSPVNGQYIEVFTDGVLDYAGLLASIDSITIEGYGGADSIRIENLPPIPVTVYGTLAGGDAWTINALSGAAGLTIHAGSGSNTLTVAPGGEFQAVRSPITFNGGKGTDIVSLAPVGFGTAVIDAPLVFNGGDDPDLLILTDGNLDALTGLVTFNGGEGADVAILNDQVPLGSYTYNTTASAVTRNPLFAGMGYASVEEILIYGGPGASKFKTAASVTATVRTFGNAGHDTLLIDDSGHDGLAFWTVYPTYVNRNLVLDSRNFSTEGFESVEIAGGLLDDWFTISGRPSANLTMRGGPGADTFNLNDVQNYKGFADQGESAAEAAGDPYLHRITIDAGDDGDIVNVNDQATAYFRAYVIEAGVVGGYDGDAPIGLLFNYAGVEFLNINAGEEGDSFSIGDLPPSLTAIALRGNGGNDSFRIGTRLGNIFAPVQVDGGAGFNTLTIDNAAYAQGLIYGLTDGHVAIDDGGFPGLSDRVVYSHIGSVSIAAGEGDDTFNLTSMTYFGTLNLAGGAGVDTFNLGTGDNIINEITGLLAVDGQNGQDFIYYHDENAVRPGWSDSYIITSTQVTHSAIVGGLSFGHTVNYANIDFFYIDTHAGDTAMQARSLPYGMVWMSVNFGEGSDSVVVGDNGRLDGIRASLLLYEAAVTLDDTADTDGSRFHISDYYVGSLGGDSLFGPGGALLSITHGDALTLNLGSGPDSVVFEGNPSNTTHINAGDPAGIPGDSLHIVTTNTGGATLTPAGPGSGQYDYADPFYLPVYFTGIEQTSTGGHPPYVEAAFLNAGAGAMELIYEFSADVSASLWTDDLSLMNLTTGETIAGEVLAMAYDPATDSAAFTLPGGVLPTGSYQATLLAAGIAGPDGTPLLADHEYHFVLVVPAGSDLELRLNEDGDRVQFYGDPTADPIFEADMAGLPRVVVEGDALDNLLAVNLINGNPIPASGLAFNAGDGYDRLVLSGGIDPVHAFMKAGIIIVGGNVLGVAHLLANDPGTPLAFTGIEHARIIGTDAGDDLTIDFAEGNPVPDGGLAYDGGAGNDSLLIVGQAGLAGSMTPDAAAFGSGTLTVELALITFSGIDPVEVSGFDSFALITPGSADIIGIDSQAASSVVSGTSDGAAFASLVLTGVPSLVLDTSVNHSAGDEDAITVHAGPVWLQIAGGAATSLHVDRTAEVVLASFEGLTALSAAGAAKLSIAPGGQLLRALTLSLIDGATFDVADGELWLAAGDADAVLTETESLIAAGRIISSTASPLEIVAVVRDSETNQIRLRGTIRGDLNLDRQLNGDDYFILDSAFLSLAGMAHYGDGDVSGDGALDGNDYLLMDLTYLSVPAMEVAAGIAVSLPVAAVDIFGARPIRHPGWLEEEAAILAA